MTRMVTHERACQARTIAHEAHGDRGGPNTNRPAKFQSLIAR
jgi:hypothetical protein